MGGGRDDYGVACYYSLTKMGLILHFLSNHTEQRARSTRITNLFKVIYIG